MIRIKGISDNIVIVLVLLALAIFSGIIKLGTQPESAIDSNAVATQSCGDDQLSDIKARFRNGLALSSSDWDVATVYAVKQDGTIGTSQATVATGLYGSTANVLECGESYKGVVINSASFYGETVYKPVTKSLTEFDIVGVNTTDVKFTPNFLNYTNMTSTSGVQDSATNNDDVITTGDTRTYRLDVEASTGSAQFGYPTVVTETATGVSGQAFVCADFSLSKYAKQDVTLSFPFIIGELGTLPAVCSSGGYEKAWSIKPVKSSDGVMSGTIKITASLGNPSTSDDVKLYFADMFAYTGADGKQKYGTLDDSSAVGGETDRYMTFAMG